MRVGLALYGEPRRAVRGFRYDRKLVEGLRRAGDTVEVVELPWRTYPRGLLDNALPDFGDRLRVDVDVMLQDELAHPSLLLANRDLPYPIVSIVHHLRASEPRRLSPLYRAVERRYLATVVDGVVCNSAATRDAVAALGVARDSTVVARPPATGSIPLSTTPKSRRGHGIVRWVRFSSETSSRERGSTRSSRRWLWRTPTSSSPSWAGPSTRNTSPRSGGWSASAGSTSACVLPADCRTPSWPRPSVRATSSRSPPGTRGSGSSTWRG